MRALTYFPLFFALSSLTFAQEPGEGEANDPTPAPEPASTQANPASPTLPADEIADPQHGAIVPTASGQIGINPVDLPSASHARIGVDTQYLTEEGKSTKWIGVDKWFSGSATVGAGQPDATGHAVPKGFQVSVAEDGSVEIGLSQWVHDKLDAIAEGIPACPAKRRREDVSACIRRRPYQFAEEVAQDSDLVEQIEALSSELAEAAGGEGYAAELIEGGQTLTFGGADLIGDALPSLGAIPALGEVSPLAVGVFGSVVLKVAAFTGLMEDEDKVKTMSWKFGVGKPEAIPIPDDNDDDEEEECPKVQDIQPPCASVECKGEESDGTSKCTVGKYKKCPCVWEGHFFSQPDLSEDWKIIEKIFGTVSTNLEVECDPQSDSSGLPESLFRGGIYDKYCEQMEKDRGSDLIWVVDQEGNQIPIKGKRGGSDQPWLPRGLHARTPPVDSDAYKGYIIELMWEPTEDGGGCAQSCKDALHEVATSPCGHAGPHQNAMAGESKYNVLCGQYTVTIQPPKNPPEPPHRTAPAPSHPTPTQHCWERDEFGKHGPVKEELVRKGAKHFCESVKPFTLPKNAKDPRVGTAEEHAPNGRWKRPILGTHDAWYAFAARRDVEKCGREHDPVSIKDTEGLTSCENLLVNNYKECKNGGTGGWIQDGCVEYMFWPYRRPAVEKGSVADGKPVPDE